jgi:hypothetical protein
MRTNITLFVMKSILLALSAALVAAQTFTGGVSGTIRDSSGGVIPQVEVKLRNLDTNDLRVQTTNEQGYYSFVAVPPGRYRLEAERTGFSRFVREPIEIRVQQFVSLDAVLTVGETAQSVEVSSAVALLDPNTSSLGQVVENRQITELPLNGRNTLAFVELTPGIRIQGTMGENPATVNYMGWGNFSSNGGLANANEVLVDGAPVTSGGLNSVGYVPPVDATQEFRVQTNAYSAEFGRSAGAIVNLSIKSGTNQYHGSVYEFFRNNVLDANDFFLNRAGRPRPALQYNQFGFSVGGPIVKNRTFFFGNYEAFRQRQGIALTTTVPTALERSGDFSQTFNASGQMVVIADPRTTRPGPDGTLIRSPFPNNRIPVSQMDPVAERLRNLVWALPTNPGRGPSGVDNFAASSKQATNTDQFVTRLDHQFSGTWRMFGTYAYQFYDLGPWDIFGNKTTTADFGRAEKNRIHNVVLSATGVLRPTLVAELRASYNRLSSNRTPPSTGFDLTSIGWPRSLVDQFQFKTFPTIQVAGVQALDASTSSTIQRANGSFSESASLTWIRGKHNLKFGLQHRLWQIRDAQNNVGTPTLTFNPRFTSLDPLRVTAASGVGMASFLLGMGSGGTVAIVQPLAEQRWYWSFFVQDDWKVTSKLTLNVGLQYSLDSPLNERYDRLAWFDPAAVPPIAQTVGLPLSGALRFVDRDNRYPQELFTKQWAPRFGFAYQWRPRTVFRGGYGIFWLPNNLLTTNSASGVAPMVSVSTPWVTSLDNGITPADLLANPFPNGLLQPPGKKDGLNTLIGQNMASIGFRNDRPGYMQQWNFNIQQELWINFAIDIAYAGSKGTALPAALPLNELPSEYLSLGNRLNEQVDNPFFGRVSTGPLAQRTVSRGQLLRPFPHFNNITHWGSPSGSSNYHSMQLKVTKRFSASLLGVAYTISKGIGDVESWSGAWLEQNVFGIGNFLYMTNYNRRLDRSINLFDVPQRFVVSYTLEAPLGRGKALLNNLGKADILVSGWEVSGIYTLQSGTPLLFFTASNLTNTFQGGARPNNNGKSAKLDEDAHSRLTRWFDTSVFSQPPAFTFGNASRTSPDVRNHHTNNLDAAFLKNNRFGSDNRFNLQFRAEFFNMFNRVRFGNPGVTQGTPQFGVVSAQINRPRLVQFALKFLF